MNNFICEFTHQFIQLGTNILFPKMPCIVARLGVEELDFLCMVELGNQMEKKYFKETPTNSMPKINEFTVFFCSSSSETSGNPKPKNYKDKNKK